MAKRKVRRKTSSGKVVKAQAIRDMLGTMGVDAANKDVISELKRKRVEVSPAQVSNVKASLRNGGLKKRGRKPKIDQSTVLVAALLEAKRLVQLTGDIDSAKRTLDTLALVN